MIGEGLISMFTGFVKFVLDLLPDSDAPAWLTNGTGALATVWSYAAGLGAWIPWSFVAQVVSAVLAAVAIGFTIKLVRIVASFFTMGGGLGRMIVAAFVVVTLLVVLVRHRAARKSTLSGLNGERPVFSVDPPTRRLGSRKGERL